MALDLEVATSTLSRIELCKRAPSIEMLERIAIYLDVAVSEIFRAAEGHPISLHRGKGRKANLFEYTKESLHLMAEIQGTPPENTRLITELAKVINKELGGTR